MISIQAIRDDPDAVKAAIGRKGEGPEVIDRLLANDGRRRELLAAADAAKHERNAGSKEVGELVRAGKTDEAEARKASLGSLGERIAALDSQLAFVEAELEADLLMVPNPPRDEVPDGNGPDDNPVVRSWGGPLAEGERPAHWDIGARLNLFDLERGAKIAGTGFVLYTGSGARLVRALISLFLDMATQRGYTEVWPPVLVNEDSARGTGQIPDKEAQMYAIERDGLYLAPTAEVPVTNIHRDEILAAAALPIRYAAYTPCFRREAGAAGKDTRGLLRVHQFDKVELVKFVTPDTSDAELETLTADAEAVLQALELPFRTVERCTGDVGFAQARGYDLEAWAPGVGKWLEISSCSNYTDFQARRMNVRYRSAADAKPELVHTLNGSGVALARTIAALLENHLQPDGSVAIPVALRPHFGADSIGG